MGLEKGVIEVIQRPDCQDELRCCTLSNNKKNTVLLSLPWLFHLFQFMMFSSPICLPAEGRCLASTAVGAG